MALFQALLYTDDSTLVSIKEIEEPRDSELKAATFTTSCLGLRAWLYRDHSTLVQERRPRAAILRDGEA